MTDVKRAWGDGSERQRGKGWEVRGAIQGTRRSYYAKTKKEAWAKFRKAQQDAALGLRSTSGRAATLGTYLADWIDGRASLRPATERRYRQIVEGHLAPALGHLRLNELQPEHVDRLLRAKRQSGLAPETVNHIRTVLGTALAHAERRRLVAHNAARQSERERVPHREMGFMDAAQVEALLAAIAGWPMEPLIATAIHTGLRQGELLGLRWEDWDRDSATLQVRRALQAGQFVDTKTSRSRRTVDLSQRATAALRAQWLHQAQQRLLAGDRWNDSGLIFTTAVGRYLGGSWVTREFQRYLRLTGAGRLRFHDLRHTHASLLIAAGLHPRLIMERLGHSSISVTMDRYGHLFPAAGKEAARLLDQMFGTAAAG